MKNSIVQRTARLMAELALQIVPPAILAAFAANELAKATEANFAQAAGIVTAVLLLCVMFNTLRD